MRNRKRLLKKCLARALALLMLCSGFALAQDAAQLVLPSALLEIGAEAFLNDDSLESVIISEGSLRIGSRAFAGSSIKSLVLPGSMESIAPDAFEGCEGMNVTAPDGSYALFWAMDAGYAQPRSTDSSDFMYELTEEGGIGIFAYQGTDAHVVVPAEIDGYPVHRLLEGCFAGNTNLQSIYLPDSILGIGGEAFGGCTALQLVRLSKKLETIETQAFRECTALNRLELPDSLMTISADIFEDCTGITALVGENSIAHSWCLGNEIPFELIHMDAAVPDPGDVTYRALLIANTYPDTNIALYAPDDDALGMMAMLKQQKATPYALNTRFNLSGPGILEAIESAFAGADDNDISLFYYSGHGKNTTESEYIGALHGIGDTFVTVDRLRAALDGVSGRKIVLLDSCFSGAYIGRSAGTSAAQAFNNAVISAFAVKSRANLAADSYTVMTACSQTESSYERSDAASGTGYGFFTAGLARGGGYDTVERCSCDAYADKNGNADGQTSLEEAYAYACSTVKSFLGSAAFSQNVQYYGDPEQILWAAETRE